MMPSMTDSDAINAFVDQALIDGRVQQAERHYLGASQLGGVCARAIQYAFTQTPKDADKYFSGQSLRIFAIGHHFEHLMLQWLRQAGFVIMTEDSAASPLRFSVADGRIRGHVDGIITALPDGLNMPVPMLWECKTMKHKHWQTLQQKGLAIAKPLYAAQIALYQAYMTPHWPGLSEHPALFTALNKDTAMLYHEWVPFDAALAQRMSDKAANIIKACDAAEWLPRLSRDPHYYACRLCAWQRHCHEAAS